MTPRRKSARGFTLIEVILAIGLMTVLFGVLYQTLSTHVRVQDQTTAEVKRMLRARSLLHRIAEELRSIVPVVVATPGDPASQARPLLDIGSTGLPAGFPSAADTSGPADAAIVKPADAFGLLGRSDRLMMRTWVNVTPRTRISQTDLTLSPEMSAGLEDPRPRSALRQVIYALKRPKQTKPAVSEEPAPTPDGDTLAIEKPAPLPGLLIRQELLFPDAVAAAMEARAELQRQFAEEAESANPTSAVEPQAALPTGLPENVEIVRSQTLADDAVDLRFRYHNGISWVDRWDDALQLPVAVEIAIRFADDAEPETEEGELPQPKPTFEPLPVAGIASDWPPEFGPRWFIHRLVVALPAGQGQPRAKMEAAGFGSESAP